MIPGQTTQFGPETEFLDAPTKTSDSSDVATHGYLTEVVNTDDPRADSQLFEVAKAEEINGLRKRKTWRVMSQKDHPERANVLSGRFVLTLQNVGTKEEKAKARNVSQGHRDKQKRKMVHNVTSLRQSSTRLIVSVAAVKGFRIFPHDVTQAYLQSDEKLTRQLFLRPKKGDLRYFQIDANETLHLFKPIYGTTDAGDYWGVT